MFEITTNVGCPVGCWYCPQATLADAYRGPRAMTMDVFRAVLANLPDHAPVIFAGFSEPFVNPLAPQMIREAAARGPVAVNTTGRGLTDDGVDAMLEAKPFHVVLHASPRGLFASKQQIARLTALALQIVGEELSENLGQFASYFRRLPLQGRAGNMSLVQRANQTEGPLRCRPGPNLDHNIILPDGRLVLCCQDFGLRHVLGNLAEQPYAEIRNGEPFRKLIAAMVDGECLCRTCEYADPG